MHAIAEADEQVEEINPSLCFRKSAGRLRRELKVGERLYVEEVEEAPLVRQPSLPRTLDLFPETIDNSLRADFFVSALGDRPLKALTEKTGTLHFIDLFCGGGGLSLGIRRAAEFLGFKARLLCAVDTDEVALRLVKKAFSPLITRSRPVEDLVRYDVDRSGALDDFISAPTMLDAQIAQFKGKVDLLIAGPPCQGHSNLNNKTRGFDNRNLLYFTVPAFAVALGIPKIIIENVRSIEVAEENVVEITTRLLERHGYEIEKRVLNAADFGTAQSRQRHFLVAGKKGAPNLKKACEHLKVNPLSFNEACLDMEPLPPSLSILEDVGDFSPENKERIDYLHDHDTDDLPNSNRPECHRVEHSYPAVYGRIRGKLPMTTITTGFSSPGRGRFVHPRERRTINIREAGRVQGFPDWYWKAAIDLNFKRAHFHKIIGDAVPSFIAYPLLLSFFL
ncbi:DNA cytosine methyltransferase [Thioalkalivibrio sp. HK1]|uniref:DNA cytosine methyltransferase n=1 Tax=Thioalkalivibrio sp. HK1 TaxID=1469245 RepID=UPI00046EB047|nr:DNA cytosine methyltransferase [Thioalkalivibrio sp. HK1]